jgi:hypothetical protein
VLGVPYEVPLSAAGGTAPYTWTILSGQLPVGLSLSSAGAIRGKAAGSVKSNFTAVVTDQSGASSSKVLALRSLAAGDLAITQPSLPDGAAEQLYSASIGAMGGTAPYRWVLEAGKIPNGLAAATENNTFTLTGQPQDAGLFSFTLRVEDSAGQSDRAALLLRVKGASIEVLASSLPDTARGQPYDSELTSNAQGATWTLGSGELPNGLSLTAAGHVQGTVSSTAEAKIYTFLAQASDGKGGTGVGGFSIDVIGPATAAAATKSGCAQTNLPGALLVAALIAIWYRRMRRMGALLMASALLSTPAVAAPTPPPTFIAVTIPAKYQPLTTGTTLTMSDPNAGFGVVPLAGVTPAFTVPYFGQQVSTFTVAVDGYLVMGATTDTASNPQNASLPNTSAPGNLVAPWWTDLQLQAGVSDSIIRWSLVGTAPNRTLIIEWNNVAGLGFFFTPPPLTFQVQISEGGDIVFNYAPNASGGGNYSATIGLQNMDGTAGLMAAACGGFCDLPNLPANQEFLFTLKAALTGSMLTVPPVIYGGIPVSLSATVTNAGATDAAAVAVALYLSQTPSLTAGLTPNWMPAPQDIRSGLAVTYTDKSVTIPLDTPPGMYFPILVIDPTNSVSQATTQNQLLVGSPIQVGVPGPDLTVFSVTSNATRIGLGGAVNVDSIIANIGNLPALCHWRVVLSVGRVISLSDRVVAEGMIALSPGSMQDVPTSFTIPADLQPGPYQLGTIVEVDPSQPQAEINTFNNTAKAATALTVNGTLVIATTELPPAAVGALYAFQLASTGGDGVNLWSLASGSALPPGVTLSPTGMLGGIPSVAGKTTFTVSLSGFQTQSVSAELTLQVGTTMVPLSLPEMQLPAAILEQSYETQLVATGGVPPYVFALKVVTGQAGLPNGVAFDATGIVAGVPQVTGNFALTVQVSDHTGERVTANITLRVVSSGRPFIALGQLTDALVGQAYTTALTAVGGVAPYHWQLTGASRIGDDTTATVAVDAPPGLSVSADGTLHGMPTASGTYSMAVQATDAAKVSANANLLLVVRPGTSVAILTRRMLPAIVGHAYNEPIVAAGGSGQLTFSLLDANQVLPDGLSLGADGSLKGTPAKVERPTFVVRVVDSEGLSDERPLTIDVQTPPVSVASKSGCSSVGTSGLTCLLVLMLLRRRPRRTAAVSAVLALGLVLNVAACSSKSAAKTTPCDSVKCQPGEVCDASDGVCKCGSANGRACTELEQCNPGTLSCELLDRCTLVTCARGMVCDASDGQCRCGTSTCDLGTVCAPQQKTCVPEDACAGVTCVAGLACDPGDGQCKCGGVGGAACAAGERCDQMKCSSDPCASVACPSGSTCDPSDAQCHCGGTGGEICLYGQTCQAAQKKCQVSTLCATAQCVGGTSCDPVDGLCHCGGSTGPVCGTSQTCDLAKHVCLGGDHCMNVTCPTNTVCNSEDGTCHCGSLGPICTSDQACITNGSGTSTCRQTCDPVSQTPCDASSACVYSLNLSLSLCGAPGSGHEGDLCGATSECGRGLACAVQGFNGYCRAYCQQPDGVCADPVQTCHALDGAPSTLGACETAP